MLRLVGEFDGSRMGYGEDDAQAVENIAQQLHDPVQREEIRRTASILPGSLRTRKKKSRWTSPSVWSRSGSCPLALTPEQAQIEEIAGYLEEAGYAGVLMSWSRMVLPDCRALGGKGDSRDVAGLHRARVFV